MEYLLEHILVALSRILHALGVLHLTMDTIITFQGIRDARSAIALNLKYHVALHCP